MALHICLSFCFMLSAELGAYLYVCDFLCCDKDLMLNLFLCFLNEDFNCGTQNAAIMKKYFPVTALQIGSICFLIRGQVRWVRRRLSGDQMGMSP